MASSHTDPSIQFHLTTWIDPTTTIVVVIIIILIDRSITSYDKHYYS